jgi:thioredoxin reductase
LAGILLWPMPVSSTHSTYDCVIIGGGPAGLTCAIFLGRYRLRVVLLDNGRPRNYASRGIHGFLGHHSIAPLELIKRGRAEAEACGVELRDATAMNVERVGDVFEVATDKGVIRGRRVVLAYGVRDVLPDVPEVERFYGGSVFHCPDCDGYECTGKKIGVIGWGRKVVGLSMKLMQWSDEITIFTDGHDRDFDKEETSKLLALGIDIVDEKIVSLDGDGDQVKAAVLSTGERLPIDAMFFTIGVERTTMLAERVGCGVVEDTPCLQVNDWKETTVEGVYAIGDLVPGSQLAITSAADGAIAAIAINKSLLPPARRV